MTSDQRMDLIDEVKGMVGSLYNWATYAYLTASRLRVPFITGKLAKRLARSEKLICSWAVEELHRRVGLTLIPGKRPYDVYPGHYGRYLI